MVNFVILTGPRDAQITKRYFWVCVWEGFQRRLTFELVHWVKQIVYTRWLGIIQSAEGANITKEVKEIWINSVWLFSWDIISCPWHLDLRLSDPNKCLQICPSAPRPSNYSTAFLGLQLADYRSQDFSVFIIVWGIQGYLYYVTWSLIYYALW